MKHGTIQEDMARCTWKPMEKVSHNRCRRQVQRHTLRIIYPHLFTMIAVSIDCQVASIWRELHRQDTIRLLKTKFITKMCDWLGIAKWLTACSPGRTC